MLLTILTDGYSREQKLLIESKTKRKAENEIKTINDKFHLRVAFLLEHDFFNNQLIQYKQYNVTHSSSSGNNSHAGVRRRPRPYLDFGTGSTERQRSRLLYCGRPPTFPTNQLQALHIFPEYIHFFLLNILF